MVNKAILIGNLCADPEYKQIGDSNAVATVRLATNEKFKNRDGELQERTEFHRVKFWGRQAETIDRYARKGNALYVEGRIETSEYTDREGAKRWATDIVARDFRFIGGKRDRDEAPREERSEEPSGESWGD